MNYLNSNELILLGSGGHARVVLDMILRLTLSVKGILDPGLKPSSTMMGILVLGGDEMLSQFDPNYYHLVNGLGAVPGKELRKQRFQELNQNGYYFSILVHPTAVVSPFSQLDAGTQVMAGAVIQANTQVGLNVVINTRASIDHDCRIGDHTFIGPGATVCGGVTVGDNTFIGAGAVILPNIKIEERAIVGAGAIITKNVSAGTKVITKKSLYRTKTL